MKHKLYWQYAASCCLLLFIFLGYIVSFYPEQLTGINNFFTSLVRSDMSDTKNAVFIWITKFGNVATITVITALFSLFLWKMNYFIEAVWFLLNVAAIAGLGNHVIKAFFQVPRPALHHLVTAKNSSFPSGHAMASLLCYGTIILLLPLFIKKKKVYRSLQVILGILILCIGISRIYVGVHYPTDVLAGFALGASWLLASYPIYQKQKVVYAFKKKRKEG